MDCVRFVVSVYHELFGERRIPRVKIPQDAAMHVPDLARRAMRTLLRAYEPFEMVDFQKDAVQPGDVGVIALQPGAGPGHAVIVGPDPATVWHATGSEIQVTGIGMVYAPTIRLCAVYRSTERERWLKR